MTLQSSNPAARPLLYHPDCYFVLSNIAPVDSESDLDFSVIASPAMSKTRRMAFRQFDISVSFGDPRLAMGPLCFNCTALRSMS